MRNDTLGENFSREFSKVKRNSEYIDKVLGIIINNISVSKSHVSSSKGSINLDITNDFHNTNMLSEYFEGIHTDYSRRITVWKTLFRDPYGMNREEFDYIWEKIYIHINKELDSL